ncbi:hypothetical protein [Pseudoramibacter sp.]|jgi:hypothetical protein|uniref:hypothetical protein n=1 Tax=Pseudoramibacter sp. TaxID=2034862 RepID=UPI0025F3351C|nr:hypothetical protein [Pseudoramibacter sp.]MCH4071747.1 hypothetical protein [Pseudoramibacter sp.]MCH4105515.1 hypothetical protein [Pseudoramibacter sp.]
MEKQPFFKTDAGFLTLAFIAIVIGTLIVRGGMAAASTAVQGFGVAVVLVALCAVPLKTYVFKRK